jgi:hypothetical protein
MGDLDASLKAAENARRRKRELRRLLEVLYQEYQLVKTEIKLHEAHIEELMSAREYSAYLDTLRLDKSLEFPVHIEQESSTKK